jgi:hypothetical protein
MNRQRQVWFGALQQTHHADTAAVVRIYFDKKGNLYPSQQFFIPYKNFFDPERSKKTISEKPGSGNLENYFMQNGNRMKNLAAIYKLDGSAIISAKDSFYAVQEIIRKNIIGDVQAPYNDQSLKTLVVFIHGFNDADPTGDYQLIRNAIRKEGLERPGFVYLEVFWDGLTTNQGNPIYENIWKRALQNSAYVSIELRKILSALDQSVQIRIITHSLGASIGTGALFNTTTKWEKNGFRKTGKHLREDYGMNFFENQKTIITPTQPARIGMIAPAIPGYNTFIDFNKRVPGIAVAQNNIDRIIVGYNVNDFAVTKRALGKDLARYFGSTSLGCNCTRKGITELERTATVLDEIGYDETSVKQMLQPVDFSEYERRKRSEEHGLYYYLQNQQKTKEFLTSLFR